MKAILIDPTAQSVTRIEISQVVRLGDYFNEKPQVAMKLPKGDILLAGVQEHAEAFVLGGSRPIAGPGLIVGQRTGPGERGPARIRLDDVAMMVRWTNIELRLKAPVSMRAIVIDPEQGLIEEVVIAPHKPAIERLLGGEIGPSLRVPGNDHVMGPAFDFKSPWLWRKDDLVFSSRCVIVGRDPATDYFTDVFTSVDNLRASVEFRAPEGTIWKRYTDRRTQEPVVAP